MANDAPVASDQSVETPEDTPITITLAATDVDNDDSSLTYFIVSPPEQGSLSAISGQSLTFTPPDPDWNDATAFTFKANDNEAIIEPKNRSTIATIMITAINDRPVAISSAVTTASGFFYLRHI
mgnify:CR=1 FL=1